MAADNKQGEQKASKPIIPRDKNETVIMLCEAARDGNLTEISRLATWKNLPRDDQASTPPIVNGKMWERTDFEDDEDSRADTDLTSVCISSLHHINYQNFPRDYLGDEKTCEYPLFAALEAPNAEAFLKLMSFEPQYFINKHPFQLIRSIIWWPLWPWEEKLKALEAVWNVLLPEQLKLLKGKNGAVLKKEDLSDFLKYPVAKQPRMPKKEEPEIEASEGTPLTKAVERGDLKEVKRLLDQGASIEETDNEGNTALLIACSERDVAMMRLLFENGASVVAKNNRGETALVLAARPMLGDHTALRRTATYF